jgi:beta-glucosidase
MEMSKLTASLGSILTKDFQFGVSTSAFQIEGFESEGGRTPSIWDRFCDSKLKHLRDPDLGCDHYQYLDEDIACLKKLGVSAYRFSISWSRLFPTQNCKPNKEALTFYQTLSDKLLAANITPYATLYHWDLPLYIYDQTGGFISRDTAYHFADYAEQTVQCLGDKINHWITINEPFEHAFFGHVTGEHAPGLKRPWQYFNVMHNQLLAHGLAVAKIRKIAPSASIGISISLTPIHPFSQKIKDIKAAKRVNELINFMPLDALLKGHYSDELISRYKKLIPDSVCDMKIISQKIDFLGVNNYQRELAKHSYFTPKLKASVVKRPKVKKDYIAHDVQYTSMGWEVNPCALSEVLAWLRDYGNPTVIITENGAAFEDNIVQGEVNDTKRINYLHDHIDKVADAMKLGSRIQGYFVWSLLDNFEWAEGFEKRFGLVHVDHRSKKRTLKMSGKWYAEFILSCKQYMKYNDE